MDGETPKGNDLLEDLDSSSMEEERTEIGLTHYIVLALILIAFVWLYVRVCCTTACAHSHISLVSENHCETQAFGRA